MLTAAAFGLTDYARAVRATFTPTCKDAASRACVGARRVRGLSARFARQGRTRAAATNLYSILGY